LYIDVGVRELGVIVTPFQHVELGLNWRSTILGSCSCTVHCPQEHASTDSLKFHGSLYRHGSPHAYGSWQKLEQVNLPSWSPHRMAPIFRSFRLDHAKLSW